MLVFAVILLAVVGAGTIAAIGWIFWLAWKDVPKNKDDAFFKLPD